MLVNQRARSSARYLDPCAALMLIIAVAALLFTFVNPSIWLLLSVPVLVFLDGLRVEYADYVPAHTPRDQLAKQEIQFGLLAIIGVTIALVIYECFT